jgi:hypothetical protein
LVLKDILKNNVNLFDENKNLSRPSSLLLLKGIVKRIK